MATPLYKVVVSLPRKTGVPADDSVNVWHFEADEQIGQTDDARWEEQLPGLVSRVKSFYNGIAPLLSSTIGSPARLQVINMRDEKPVYARYEEAWMFDSVGPSALPSEVALCLSMEGRRESGAVMRRRRGRVFLGPLNANLSVGGGTSGDPRPDPATLDAILDAAVTMARGADDQGAARLAVYSPTTLATTGSQDEAWNDVARLWMDNAFDTMRSRGTKATGREVRDLDA